MIRKLIKGKGGRFSPVVLGDTKAGQEEGTVKAILAEVLEKAGDSNASNPEA